MKVLSTFGRKEAGGSFRFLLSSLLSFVLFPSCVLSPLFFSLSLSLSLSFVVALNTMILAGNKLLTTRKTESL